MDEEKIMDQGPVAKSIANKIPYEFTDDILVKPLDPIKVTKTFSKPVSNGSPTTDVNDIKAIDFDDVETEVKEVNSDFRKGIVLKIPRIMWGSNYENTDGGRVPRLDIRVGDVIVFPETNRYFDLVKDTMLVKSYNVIAVESTVTPESEQSND